MMLAINAALVGVFAWFVVGQSWWELLGVAPAIIGISVLASVILWPLRFGDWGPPSAEHLLRYRRANRIEHGSASGRHLDTADGMFDLASLKTLRMERVNGFGGLVNLVFDGKAVCNVLLVDWPGLPEDVAASLCEALLSKAGSVTKASP